MIGQVYCPLQQVSQEGLILQEVSQQVSGEAATGNHGAVDSREEVGVQEKGAVELKSNLVIAGRAGCGREGRNERERGEG